MSLIRKCLIQSHFVNELDTLSNIMSGDIFLEDVDLFSQCEARFFSIFFPLFHQSHKPNAFINVMFWIIFTIQLIALALFRIDNSTQAQTALSRIVNFIDLSSLSLMIGKNSIFLVVVQINEAGEQIQISYWRAASDNIFVYCLAIDLLIFNFNPKNGGLFSCPDGFFNFIQHLFIQSLIPWIIFGSVRLCVEIGYALERRFYSIIPQIILLLINVAQAEKRA
ncbi:MAG: hypothetical protein EZS28_008322 [Streblomastix strix]|uniref:Uncharacterized protein n=1 Tax=Streblomastix strix TaxID=222440 RepID=A0A5J4WMP0_9EUKA|nr:MAG: hypothetical protein EZS28_008322 [Streblomastix strix]